MHWLQTARWHADLRIPADREGHQPGTPLDAMTPAQHLALAQQQGFFGRTEVQLHPHGGIDHGHLTGIDHVHDHASLDYPLHDNLLHENVLNERCTWHRLLDLQPPARNADAGWLEFTSPDRLVETGVHGSYLEVWERLPDTTGRCVVLTNRDGAFWLLSGTALMHVRPRRCGWPADTQPGDTLATVVTRHPHAAAGLLDFEISYGLLQAGHWSIAHSSLPARAGCRTSFALNRTDAATATVALGGQISTWQVREWTDSVAVGRVSV